MKKIVLSVLIALTAISASAQTFVKDNITYYIYDTSNNYCYVIDGKNASGDVVIPNPVVYGTMNYTVNQIDENAFAANTKLTSIKFEAPINNIMKGAFRSCSNLKTVDLGTEVTNISSEAFAYCTSLKTITLPEEFDTFGESAFSNCNALESIVIPDKVKTIPNNCFRECKALSTVVIGAKVQYINPNAFYNDLLTNVTIKSRTLIETDYTFEDYISKNLFVTLHLYNSSGTMKIDCRPTKIGNYAFARQFGSRTITQWDITFPNSIKTIGTGSFRYFKSRQMELPEGLTTIGSEAFYYATIGYFVIPSTLTKIENNTFNEAQIAVVRTRSNSSIYGNMNTTKVLNGTIVIVDNLKMYYVMKGRSSYKELILIDSYPTNEDEDVNHDGQVNSLDALKVYKYMQAH